MFGLFDDLFGFGSKGDAKKVETDLLVRIRDLEQWAARKDQDAYDRIFARDKCRKDVTKEDRDAFEKAFRTDLEWARLRLFHKDHAEDEKYPIEGKKSLAAAKMAHLAAFYDNWELAKALFAQAQAYVRHQGWTKSIEIIERIVKSANVQPDVDPLDDEGIEKLYTSFETFDDDIRKNLRNASRAKAPKEWVEAMHEVSRQSRCLQGLVDEQILEAAQKGMWEEWISVAKESGYSTVYRTLEDKKPDDEIVQVTPRSTSEDAKSKTKLGQYLKAFKDDGYKAPNAERLWSIFWWACGFWPSFGSYIRKYEPQQKGGRWYLIEIKNEVWKDETRAVYEMLPDGYESKDELLIAAWKHFIYGGNA